MSAPDADSPPVPFTPATVGDLVAEYLAYLDREVSAGRRAAATRKGYPYCLKTFVLSVGPALPLAAVTPYHLQRCCTRRYEIAAVQRLFAWAVEAGFLASSPVAGVKRPRQGQRERILTRAETVRLLRAAGPEFRRFLLAMQHTIARPGEVRALRWKELNPEGTAFLLTDFKGKNRRKDDLKVRIIAVDDRLRRLLERLLRRARQARGDVAEEHIFLNPWDRPWRTAAVCEQMRELRARCGLAARPDQEAIVPYTFRHTAATLATVNGVRDRVLADLMGHASTGMTARYQHLSPQDLALAIRALHEALRRR